MTGPNQTASQSCRDEQLARDLALLARAVSHLLNVPGRDGSWTVEDFEALSELLERRDQATP